MHQDFSIWRTDNDAITSFLFTGWLRQWRCSSQLNSRYLFLDKGQVVENFKRSKDSALVILNSLHIYEFYLR